MEVIGPHCKPADWMRRIVFNQVVCAIVEFTSQAQIQQASSIDRQDFETQRISLDGFKAKFVCCRNLVVLIKSLGSDTENADIFLGHQDFKYVFFSHFFINSRLLDLLKFLYLGQIDFSEPLIFRGKGERPKQIFLLCSGDELAINKPIECLHISWIFLDALLIGINCHEFIVLRFEALGSDEGTAALHLSITVAIFQLHFQHGQTLIVLLVQKQCPSSQQLEADVVTEQFVLKEERMHFLEVSIPEIALAQQVDCCDVSIGQRHQFITEKDGIRVIMDVEIVNSEFVQSAQAFIAQDRRGKVLQFSEVMLGMAAIVGLKQFCQEEHSVCFSRREDGGLLSFFAHV